MSTGIVLFARPGADNAVDDIVDQARRAHQLGTRHVWVAQQFDHDAISLSGLIGAAVPGLGVGTSVVPFNPRHPLTVASQAQTAQAAAHGNFSLGLGLGAHEPERIAYGTAWPNTIARLREYLTILRSIFHSGGVDFHGEEFTAAPAWPATLAGGTPVPVYVAAMGPKALAATGELADGALPYLAGPRTIAEFIEPTIARAAADAGRTRPRIIAFVPAQVTSDGDAARDAANEQLAFYATIPSYQKVIAREGVENLAELAAIGDEETVLRSLRRYLDAGATDVVLSPLNRDRPDETLWELAASL
ncbi:LLM class F420-dependent oxidoreductase [Mycolicibacterium psychrotolerans]|uniref:LLM class F420-dependent oxidoreductase n=1 Tax=Mycolicibacterium psychrotolerans TaxID=216929 RepID=UPI0013D35AA3|nr:LLM class F420-dependent oxidoreductase [Mycolicibacterium psychrotolerans]